MVYANSGLVRTMFIPAVMHGCMGTACLFQLDWCEEAGVGTIDTVIDCLSLALWTANILCLEIFGAEYSNFSECVFALNDPRTPRNKSLLLLVYGLVIFHIHYETAEVQYNLFSVVFGTVWVVWFVWNAPYRTHIVNLLYIL
jgi:hypothetical protein